MGVGLAVVLETFAIQVKRQFGDLFVGEFDITGVHHFAACRFLGTGVGGLLQAFLDGVQLRIHKAITAHQPGVEHAYGGNRLEALVALPGLQRITTAAADAQEAYAFGVDTGVVGNKVGHAVNVFDTVGGFVDVARLATAGALVGGVGGNGDIALVSQALGIQARDLFLDPAVGVRDDDGRVFFARIVVGRCVHIGGDIQAVELVGNRMDIDLARFVASDCIGVGQGERVGLVVPRLGG